MTQLFTVLGPLFLTFAKFVSATSVCDIALASEASIFCSYLEDPALSHIVNGTFPVTILAFTDEAVESSVPSGKGVDIIAFMQNHIVPGMHLSSDFKSGTSETGYTRSWTLLETYLKEWKAANISGGQKIEASSGMDQLYFKGGDSKISVKTPRIMQNQRFDRGVVHILNGALQPPGSLHEVIPQLRTMTTDVISFDSDFSIFLEALYITGLMKELETDSNITILAPIDSEFYKVGSIFDGMPLDDLKEILSYHIIVNNITYGRVLSQNNSTSTWSPTTLSGKMLNATYIAYEDSFLLDSARTLRVDALLPNGNMIPLAALLNPNHTGENRFPSAKTVTTGKPLFSNIIGSTSGSTAPLNGSSSGLPTSAKAGIGAGVAICILLVCGSSMYRGAYVRRRAAESQKQLQKENSTESVSVRHENLFCELEGTTNGPELPGAFCAEVCGTIVGPELPATFCGEIDSRAIISELPERGRRAFPPNTWIRPGERGRRNSV